VSLPTKTIHTSAAKLMAGAQHLLIDTPPGNIAVVTSALRAADLILVTVQPTTADLDLLAETMSLAGEVAAMTDARVAILLTRVVPRTRAQRMTREALSAQGHHVLAAEIRQAQSVALSHGRPITDLAGYGEVLDELAEFAADGKVV